MNNPIGNPEIPQGTEGEIVARHPHEHAADPGENAQTVSDLEALERLLARLLLEVFLTQRRDES